MGLCSGTTEVERILIEFRSFNLARDDKIVENIESPREGRAAHLDEG